MDVALSLSTIKMRIALSAFFILVSLLAVEARGVFMRLYDTSIPPPPPVVLTSIVSGVYPSSGVASTGTVIGMYTLGPSSITGVQSTTVTVPGSGYTTATASITGCNAAFATPIISAGTIASVNLDTSGYGCTSPVVTISGNGMNAAATASASAVVNNFGSTPGSVSFTGTNNLGTVLDWVPTHVIVKVPAGAQTGYFGANLSGGGTIGGWINITTAGTITSVYPDNGVANTTCSVGTPGLPGCVTIIGTNFGATGVVKFNGVTAAPASYTNAQIVTAVPAGVTSGVVTVIPTGGSTITGPNFAIQGASANCNGFGVAGDGCTGAPTLGPYTVMEPAYFSGYAEQSGQTWVNSGNCTNANCHPAWAVAGVDYPVGLTCTTSCAFGAPGTITDPTYGIPWGNCQGGNSQCSTVAVLVANHTSPVVGQSWWVNNSACPSGTCHLWTWEPTSATVQGSITGTALTTTGGSPAIGQQLSGGGVSGYTIIVSGSGTNWVVNNSQSVSGPFTVSFAWTDNGAGVYTANSNYGTNAAACAISASGYINCNTVTSTAVTIQNMDWSAQGNANGIAYGLSIGVNVTGTCTLNNNNFAFDIATTKSSTAGTAIALLGCLGASGGITMLNNKFSIVNSLTGSAGIWDNNASANTTFTYVGVGPSGGFSTQAMLSTPMTFEYNALVHCATRCVAMTGNTIMKYNFFNGNFISAYTPGTGGAHGDGNIIAYYTDNLGPNGATTQGCGSSCVSDGFTFEYNNWLEPNLAAGYSTTCMICGVVNGVYNNITTTLTTGSNVVNVTANGTGLTIQPGQQFKPASGSYYWTGGILPGSSSIVGVPVFACPGGSCTGQTGNYIMNTPWTNTGSGIATDVTRPAYSNNWLWDHNVAVLNKTGTNSSTGPGFAIADIFWMGYGTAHNFTFANNYIDSCGAGPSLVQGTSACTSAFAQQWLGAAISTSFNDVSYTEGNNVFMLNGSCVSQYNPTSTVACVAPTTYYAPVATFSPASADTNVDTIGVSLLPNGTPSITQGHKSAVVGGAVTITPTVNDALIAAVIVNNGSTTQPATATCTDNATTPNIYTLEGVNTAGGGSDLWAYIFVAPIAIAGTTVTCTIAGASTQTTIVEEASNVATSSGTVNPTDVNGAVGNFYASVSGTNSAQTPVWTSKNLHSLLWAAYFGGIGSMTYGSSPFAYSSGPAGTQGSGIYTENKVP